jgi:ATP-dependent Clp protease ATP-binding subunit ClpA
MTKLESMTDWDTLNALIDQEEQKINGRTIDEKALFEHLRTRVKGQDEVLSDVARLIRLQMSKENKSRPLCNLIFLGPTGTGKTELAKAVAEFLFGDEKAMLRFDCSELSDESAKTRLIGTPLGYVGSEMGGQLTRPVLANGKRVILFDEIEKAYSGIFDLFLQLMGEGRLTEQGSGKAVDFSQTVIILTSNAHAEQIIKIKSETPDYHEMVNSVKSYLADAKVFRPEILGRIDRIYVFKALQGKVVAEIALLKIRKLAEEFKLEIEFVAPELILQALVSNSKISRFGIRELERIIFDMFAPQFAEAKRLDYKRIRLAADPLTKKIRVSVPQKARAA